MNHELVEAKRLKISAQDCEGTILTLQLIEDTVPEDSLVSGIASKTANTKKEITRAAEEESPHPLVEQFLACFFVQTEFLVWTFAIFFLIVPLCAGYAWYELPNIFAYSTIYYAGCLFVAALAAMVQVFGVVCRKVAMKQVMAPSWTEFFSDRIQREFQVDFAPDEAFARCIAVLNKTCARKQAPSLDIVEREITVNLLGRKLIVRVRATEGEGSIVSLQFVAGRLTFWHYCMILDWGSLDEYLSAFEREFSAMNSVPAPVSLVKVGRRRLNTTQLSTLFVCALSLISSLFAPIAWNEVQKVDLQNRFGHCMGSIDWVTRPELAVDEFTKVVDIATSLKEWDLCTNALTFRGYTQLRRSHLAEARLDFEKALELVTTKENLWTSDEEGQLRLRAYLIETLLRQEHFGEAETLLQQVIERGKNAPETLDPGSIHYLLGLKAFKSGDKETAVTHLLHSRRQEADQLLSVLLADAKDELRKLHLARALGNLNAPRRNLPNCPFRSPVSSIPMYLIALLGVMSLARCCSRYWITKANLKKMLDEQRCASK